MRLLVLLIALVVILAFLGWLTFSPGTERSSINIETQEIREDTRELLDSGAKILGQDEKEIDRAADQDEAPAPASDELRENAA